MSTNVTLWGASYSDVPAIQVPKTGGGVAAFHDVTDTTAVAADVATGKYFHAADGTLTEGTSSGGGGVTVEALSVTQNGTYTAPAGTAYSPVTVNVSGGGGGGASLDDPVRFFDYDGTLLHSYSAADFAALTEMPSNPSHAGLIAQGWNWNLTDAKAQVASSGSCDIGQMYITDDGKTRVYLEMPEGRLSPYLALCPNGTVTIDWGDNSGTDTLTGTSLTTLKRVQHTYPSAGSYVMTLTATSGSFAFYGTNSVPSCLRYDTGTSSTTGNRSRVYLNSIQRVELGSGVRIGTYAFNYCNSLSSITIPDGVTSIGNNAFQYCYSLTSITIPDSVTSIGNNAFQNCYSLASITIPDSVTSIGTYAFNYCNSLSSITIPDGVTSIGNNAFQYCYSLTSITIPDSVTSIGTYAFQNCYSLASITIPEDVTSIGSSAFYSCYSLTSITIPEDVTSIETYAFQNCYSLASITIPEDVTSIGSSAFYSCYSLTSITIPEDVTSIETYAFQNCYSLTSITIPEDVTSIGSYAFGACYALAEIHLKPTTPPTVANSNAWNSINTDCIIYVPSGTLSAYTSATNYPSSSTYTYVEESA